MSHILHSTHKQFTQFNLIWWSGNGKKATKYNIKQQTVSLEYKSCNMFVSLLLFLVIIHCDTQLFIFAINTCSCVLQLCVITNFNNDFKKGSRFAHVLLQVSNSYLKKSQHVLHMYICFCLLIISMRVCLLYRLCIHPSQKKQGLLVLFASRADAIFACFL